jgi:hypothetical protein
LDDPGSLDERSNDMQYWIYKNNRQGGPAGYRGDWAADVFSSTKNTQWGGSYSTASFEVLKALDERVAAGDVVAAYQTDDRVVVGFCTITSIKGRPGDRKLYLKPIHHLKTPLKIHEAKHGTVLADSIAVNGPVMLRELSKAEMAELLRSAGAPSTILKGTTKTTYKP